MSNEECNNFCKIRRGGYHPPAISRIGGVTYGPAHTVPSVDGIFLHPPITRG